MCGVHYMYEHYQLLHRNFSTDNIMVAGEGEDRFGVLVGWETAIKRDEKTHLFPFRPSSIISSSIHALELSPFYYQHNTAESVLYTLLVVIDGYLLDWNPPIKAKALYLPDKSRGLDPFYRGTLCDITLVKREKMEKASFEHLFKRLKTQSMPQLYEAMVKFRESLFPNGSEMDFSSDPICVNDVDLGNIASNIREACQELYWHIIDMGGNVSYRAQRMKFLTRKG